MRSSLALSRWSQQRCCSSNSSARVPFIPKRVSSTRRCWPSSSSSSSNANARFSPSQLRVGSMVVNPIFHHHSPTSPSSSSLFYYNTHYYHTSRPWHRLEHRQRQHHEDQQIQKSAQRIMSLFEPPPTVLESSTTAATSTTTAAASATTTAAAVSTTTNTHHNNTSIMIQFLRHLSPHARLEVERTVAKMTAHRAHHLQQHHHPVAALTATTTTTAAPATAAVATAPATSTSTTAAATPATVAASTNSTSSSTAATTTAAAAASTSTTATTKIPEPPFSELRLLMYQQAIPFVGFGIMDNAILIIAGDAIDTWLGVSFGISTMCAAAIGNIVSDVAGVMLGTVIEDLCASFGLPTPHLTEAQRTLRSVRLANQTGICVGLVIGCIIGMFPLYWIDGSKTMRLKRQAKLQDLVQDVMEEAKSLVQAERTTLFLRVASEDTNLTPTGEGQYLYAKYHTNNQKERNKDHKKKKKNKKEEEEDGEVVVDPSIPTTDDIHTTTPPSTTPPATSSLSTLPPTITSRLIPLGRGIVSRSALTGQALNLYHVQSEPDFDPDTFDLHHVTVKNMLCVPVLDEQGRAIAVIQAINKQKQQPPATAAATSPKKDKTRLQQQQQEQEQSHASTASGPSQQQKGETTTTTSLKEDMPQGFTSNDVQILKALASHISIALQSLNKDDADVTMRHTIRTLKEHGTGILEQNQNPIQCRPLFPPDESGLKE